MTWSGVACIARKDIREWLADRDSRRGFVVQAAIFLFLTGLFVPWTTPAVWQSPGEAVLLYVGLPSLIASMLCADAFAGEKERHTLESLLATPLTDAELFFGKVAAAVGLSTAVSIAAVLAGILTLAVRSMHTAVLLPNMFQCTAVLVGSLGTALTISTLAAVVSSRVPVARSAQQIVQVVFLLFTGLLGFLLHLSAGELTWRTVMRSCITLIIIGSLGLALASKLFSRERLVSSL